MLFLASVLFLSIVGILFVHSAGSYWSQVHYKDQLPFAFKQGSYLIVGILGALFIRNKSFIRLPRFWLIIYVFSILFLIGVLIPGIGVVRNGSQSWISLGFMNFQPAELAKIAVLGMLAFSLAYEKKTKGQIYFQSAVILLLPISFIMIQPDFGSAFVLIVASFFLLFAAGLPLKFFVTVGITGIVALVALIASAPYRLDRIQSFLDPWSDPLGTGFQAIQSLLAVGPAGLFGFGYGNSRQKFLYLPEPQNDFIFSILLEETGFIGGFIIISAFVLFFTTGFAMAARTKTRAYQLTIIGFTSLLAVQTFLNMGVVTGLLPVTGVTLPFISYGGSSLVTTWGIIGIILNLANDSIREGRR
ncbi:FtsW/RodA/SpoVE family cell cycle protein [Psychrobacillus sp. FJAT-21963]|uniref:FtsW/RodA/SpoVE family cell cycle protein n=1 Tax=Psychrobacillus sp. FJAT-21963 TaxID=1712028 RepID=UPI000708211F|nr:putative peptidoglycan glycosyltransferase FtsW [Psychrobacillus sp. FJAT-21963]KQL36552.1 cell division protein FtsW [Psychrobacillus sp. FJAT-21963]